MNQENQESKAIMLKEFENSEFGNLRTITKNGETLFCALDVATGLGYEKPHNAIAAHCRCPLKQGVPHPQSPEKMIEMLFLTEGDVYRLITRSKLPNAIEWESWVFDEVLPTINKHGAYATPDAIEKMISDPDYGIRLLQALKKEQEMRAAAERVVIAQQEKINLDAPYVVAAKALEASKNLINLETFSKMLQNSGFNTGRNRIAKTLTNMGLIRKLKNNEGYIFNQRYNHFFQLGTKVADNFLRYTSVLIKPSGVVQLTNKVVEYLSEQA